MDSITTTIYANGEWAGTSCTAMPEEPCMGHTADIGDLAYCALEGEWGEIEANEAASGGESVEVKVEVDGVKYTMATE